MLSTKRSFYLNINIKKQKRDIIRNTSATRTDGPDSDPQHRRCGSHPAWHVLPAGHEAWRVHCRRAHQPPVSNHQYVLLTIGIKGRQRLPSKLPTWTAKRHFYYNESTLYHIVHIYSSLALSLNSDNEFSNLSIDRDLLITYFLFLQYSNSNYSVQKAVLNSYYEEISKFFQVVLCCRLINLFY